MKEENYVRDATQPSRVYLTPASLPLKLLIWQHSTDSVNLSEIREKAKLGDPRAQQFLSLLRARSAEQK